LENWIQDKKPTDPVLFVPSRPNLRRLHTAHLEAAGLPCSDEHGFADWHSLRMSAHTYLRVEKVDDRLLARFFRHTAGE
jgi:hypothetical protein